MPTNAMPPDGRTQSNGSPRPRREPDRTDSSNDVERDEHRDTEVQSLKAELERVKADRSTAQRQEEQSLKRRRFFSTLLAVVAAILIVASVAGLWMRSTIMNSDNFAATAAPLVKNDDVAHAVSVYAAEEIVTHTNVEQQIAQVLPAEASVLSGPISSALQDGLEATVQDVIQTDEFESVFETAVKVAHEEALLILEGDGDVIESKDGRVTINLLHVINDVMRAASADLSALLGTTINLPQISANDVPADAIAEFESALGVSLPADFGQVTLFSSQELADAQRVVDRFDTLLEVIVLLAAAATVGAFALTPDRRRTVITLGTAIPVTTVLIWLIVDGAEADAFSHLNDPSARAAARAASGVLYSGLDRIAWWTIGLSLAAVAVAVFTRPQAGDAHAGESTIDLTNEPGPVKPEPEHTEAAGMQVPPGPDAAVPVETTASAPSTHVVTREEVKQ